MPVCFGQQEIADAEIEGHSDQNRQSPDAAHPQDMGPVAVVEGNVYQIHAEESIRISRDAVFVVIGRKALADEEPEVAAENCGQQEKEPQGIPRRLCRISQAEQDEDFRQSRGCRAKIDRGIFSRVGTDRCFFFQAQGLLHQGLCLPCIQGGFFPAAERGDFAVVFRGEL